MSNALRSAIILIVALVWAANFTAPLFMTDYKPAPELNVAFMAILGVLTASYNKDEKKSPKVEKKPEPDKEDSHG